VGLFLVLFAITFFRLGMVLEWRKLIWQSRAHSPTPRRTHEPRLIIVSNWIEASFALVVPAACSLVIWVDVLRVEPTHFGMLGVCCPDPNQMMRSDHPDDLNYNKSS
jgi:hypothetical protein